MNDTNKDENPYPTSIDSMRVALEMLHETAGKISSDAIAEVEPLVSPIWDYLSKLSEQADDDPMVALRLKIILTDLSAKFAGGMLCMVFPNDPVQGLQTLIQGALVYANASDDEDEDSSE